VRNEHLLSLGAACVDLQLVTGGSGIAMGLARAYRRAGLIPKESAVVSLPSLPGPTGILCGSCSEASREQARAWSGPALALDPVSLARAEKGIGAVRRWAEARLDAGESFLVHSVAEPEQVAAAQRALGREAAGALVESAFAQTAAALVSRGLRRLIVAGGETSGAVAKALGVTMLRIGPEVDPGVPWTVGLGDPALLLAFKSGNFGSREFFSKAMEVAS
jgi:uncharacterized protein YgbK (DUF1537 family)